MKALIYIHSPVIACRRILGLPALVRTIASLSQAGLKQILLIGPDGGIIQPLLRKYGWMDGVRQQEKIQPDEIGEALILSADYHFDPNFISWMVQNKVRNFDEVLDQVSATWWQKLDATDGALSQAADKIFSTIRQKTEGWVAPLINKPISFWISRRLVQTGVTPNQITAVNLALAGLGAFLLAWPSYGGRLIGAFIMYLTSILDGCDGEVARLKCLRSPFGAWFDTVADDLANNLFFIGLFSGLYLSAKNLLFLQVGWMAVAFSFGVSAVIYHQLISKNLGGDVASFQAVWSSKSQGEKGWFNRIRPIMKRDFFIAVFLVMIIFDLRVPLFWLATVATLITFLVYLVSFIVELFHKAARHSA